MADEVRNAWKGIKMPPREARELEALLLADPDNLEFRCKLLGYYSSNRFTDPIGLKKFHEHVLATIERFPESKIAGTQYARIDITMDGDMIYEQAKQLWLQQVQSSPDNPTILNNASSFFKHSDPPLSTELLNKLA